MSMRRLGLLLVLAVGATAMAALFASGGAAQKTDTTLTFVERGGTFRLIDNAPKSPTGPRQEPRLSAGDVLTISTPLYDGGDTRIGRLDAVCVATRGARFERATFICTGSFALPEGTLALNVSGRFPENAPVVGAVLGGTGAYEGARGSFTSTPRPGTDGDVSDDVVHLVS